MIGDRAGGKIYPGFSRTGSPEFRYFQMYGKDGVVRGERYKKTPGLVDETTRRMESLTSPGNGLLLDEQDTPEVVIFFARPAERSFHAREFRPC